MGERNLSDIIQSIAWHSINRTTNDEVIVSLVREAYAALPPMHAPAQGSSAPMLAPAYIIENIILRRLRENRIEGYTLAMSVEIAAALAGAALRAPEAADAGEVAWRWHPKDNPGHGWTYTESKTRAEWCLLYEHPCEPLYASPTVAPPDDAWVNDPRGKAFEMGRDAAVEVLQKHFDDHQSPEAEAIAAALSYAYAEVRCLVAPNFPMPAARPAAKADTARRLHSYILHNYASAAASSGRQKSFESNLIEMFAALSAPVAGADAGMRERAALDFCKWLTGFLSVEDELTSFDAETIRAELRALSIPSTDGDTGGQRS